MEKVDWKQEIEFFKKKERKPFRSKEYSEMSQEQVIQIAKEHQRRARTYEAEYLRQVEEGKDPSHKTSEQVLQEAEMRLHGATGADTNE